MAAPRIDRRLTAVLAADVVGYSRLVQRDEQGTLDRLKAHRQELIEPLVTEHGGRVVKLMGDGILCEFPSAVHAVTCAVAIQRGMAEREKAVPEAERIRFRIGINVGDVVHEGGDIFGDGVNVAARLQALAEPGGVLLARNVYNQIKDKLAFRFEPAGRHQVKNIAEPVEVWRVLPGGAPGRRRIRAPRPRWWIVPAAAVLAALLFLGGAWWLRPQEPALTGHPSVAVLPFDNLSGDETTGWLADGITEDIITDLSRFREFDVIARNSTGVYKGKPVDVRQVGRDLGVRYVLEGSIQRQGDRVRATAQLVDAGTGAHLWSERWDRRAGDVFAVQTEIAEQVAGRLGGGVVASAERQAARRKRPTDLTAYELYLRGVDEMSRGTKENTEEAIRLFTQAVERDPNLARAWTALSAAHDYAVAFGADLHAAEARAKEAAERAVAIDPMDADAHRALAEVLSAFGDITRAEAEFETALRLNPGHAAILANYASWSGPFGHPERGAEAADRAIRLNPHYSVGTANRLRAAYFNAGRYEDALRIVERQPPESRTLGGWLQRAASYAALRRMEEARAAVADALARHPNLSVQGLLSRPDFSEAERKQTEPLMREAGFPVCAKPEEVAKFEKPLHLPECSQPEAAK
jgi:TolB-like protein/class 3 adenylate cyclase/Tfp pilus assembly protein PilF